MKRILGIVGVLALGALSPSYAFMGRDSISSLWPNQPVQIDGRATEWSELPVVEDAGIGFRAMNDGSSLYLLLRGTTNDGRVLLAGKYHQNVTLWILKPDHKTRAWGVNLDFSRAQSPALDVPPTFSAMGITPEMVLPQGLEVSTATFPEGFEFQADLSSQRGRQPIYEIRVPLQMIDYKGKSIYIDLVSSEVSPDVKASLQAEPHGDQTHEAGAGGSPGGQGGSTGGGGRRHRGMGGSSGGGSASRSPELPKPVQLHLTIELTKEPKH